MSIATIPTRPIGTRQLSRILLPACLLALMASACPSTKGAGDQSGSLSGRWHGTSQGLTLDVALTQTGDSVSGSGTFQAAPNSSMGCGGESLPSSGNVTVAGKSSGGQFQGRMTLADTWSPPYLGTISADSLVGHFMSVDRGGCPLVLVRQR
jgi:hypothetical protein